MTSKRMLVRKKPNPVLKMQRGYKEVDEGKNGREYVVKNHSWEAVARKVAEVCKGAIVEPKKKINQ